MSPDIGFLFKLLICHVVTLLHFERLLAHFVCAVECTVLCYRLYVRYVPVSFGLYVIDSFCGTASICCYDEGLNVAVHYSYFVEGHVSASL